MAQDPVCQMVFSLFSFSFLRLPFIHGLLNLDPAPQDFHIDSTDALSSCISVKCYHVSLHSSTPVMTPSSSPSPKFDVYKFAMHLEQRVTCEYYDIEEVEEVGEVEGRRGEEGEGRGGEGRGGEGRGGEGRGGEGGGGRGREGEEWRLDAQNRRSNT